MTCIRLIHWKESEAEERAKLLEGAGYKVNYSPINTAELRSLRENLPDAVIIDLSRLPSQGRDMGVNLRIYQSTRNVPLLFVEGKINKVERVKEVLPDATYTTWENVLVELTKTISNPPSNPIVPESLMAGYAGTPLPKKLGIKAHSIISLHGAPEGFETTFGELPEGATTQRTLSENSDLVLWFVRSQAEILHGIKKMGKYAGGGSLWIVWPKKDSGTASDLTQKIVRDTGLANGLVDFKICSVDETWSALRFSQRKQR